MRYIIIVLATFIAAQCVPTRRMVGIYGTEYGDTMRVVDDHSWRIELEEPDTANNKQFKYTTGRWHKKRNRLHLTVDSKSYGDYWECIPFKVSWNKLRRNMECSGEGKNYVFHRVNYKKISRVARKEKKKEEKRKKEKEEQKLMERLEEAEKGD